MPRTIRRSVAAAVVLALGAAACGNSSDDTTPDTTAPGDTSQTTAAGGSGEAGDRDTFVPLSGVPGVTDDQIAYDVIGTRSGNPLGTCILDCYLQGVEAYFAFRNSEGGIFGRDLVVNQVLDDELANNQVRALEVTSSDDAFGVFEATLLASGWGDLDAAGIPTYTWGIHATEAANRQSIFPSLAQRCADCLLRSIPYAVEQAGATRVAGLGYGVSENSRVCAQTIGATIDTYGADIGAELAYLNDNLDFGLANGIGPEVTTMKEAGVDFIATCIDLNGMLTLAQELDRQGMDDVVLYHPNTYDQSFVAEAGGLFDGDYVGVGFLPFEADSSGTALADFLTWMDDQGNEPTELAMVGWINASLAFEGLLAAGPEFDRAGVIGATNQMTEFTAGGILEPIDWTEAHIPYTQATRDLDTGQECTALVRVVDGAFETVAPPETPWLCWDNTDPDWSEPVPTSFGG